MRVRFAPSPTGYLHVGNARTALFNWLLARRTGGSVILRIEDTDTERSTRESEAALIEDLRWLGLDWDEGPDVGGQLGPYRQSERLELYRERAEQLLEGGAAYRCFCTAAQLERDRQTAHAAGRQPQYAGRCRALDPGDAARRVTAGERAVVRLRVPTGRTVTFDDIVRGRVEVGTEVIGDPVLLKSDGWPAYNFAVVVDDAAMRVSYAIRGEDHLSNTPRQVLLYEALGLVPPRFAHLSLVMGPDHTPLSKRHGATSIAGFRARGYLPEALVNYLALIGWSPGGDDELLPVSELVRRFSLEAVGRSPGVFDERKLAWVDRHYLKAADPTRLVRLALPFFEARGHARAPDADGLAFLSMVVAMAAPSVDCLAEIPERVRFLFAFDPVEALRCADVREAMSGGDARDVIIALAEELSRSPRLDRDSFRAVTQRVGARTGLKGRQLLHPIRMALTGEAGGPQLDMAVPAIDRGAELPAAAGVSPIVGARERAVAFAAGMIQGRDAAHED